jgi:hypothetical protein
MVQFAEDFPLNLYLMSRIPQWFAVKVLRTSIIECQQSSENAVF